MEVRRLVGRRAPGERPGPRPKARGHLVLTTKRTDAQKWAVSADDYGRSLAGLTLNLLVRDGIKLSLHADHTYAAQPWAPRFAETGKRGFGAEIRILGIPPEAAERRARDGGYTVLHETKEWPHGWRDCVLEDPDGYTPVGETLPEPT